MTENERNYTSKDVTAVSEAAWLVASDRASREGVSIQTHRGRSGTFIVAAGVAEFIRLGAKEVNLARLGKDRDFRKVCRQYLKARLNMAAISKIEGERYQWRIFVASEWRNTPAPSDGTETRYISKKVSADVDRLTQGESGPVTKTNLWDEFASKPLSDPGALVIKCLHENGGRYRDDRGFTSRDLTGQTEMSGPIATLEERDLIRVTKKHAKAFAEIALTTKGWWAAERLSYVQTTTVAVAAFLSKVGSFEGSRPRQTTAELGELVHRPGTSVAYALRELEDSGDVVVRMTTDKGVVESVKWIGDNNVPGVHITSPPPVPEPRIEDGPADGPVSVPDAPESTTPTVTPSAPASPSDGDTVRFTHAQARSFMDAMIEAAGGGVDPDHHENLKQAIAKIHGICKAVERGDTSALRAVADIEDITRENGGAA